MVIEGGPEHRVNFHSVKIPLILLFKELKLDSLVAIGTTPEHSYCNIVERIMSILNISIQNVALERDTFPSDEVIKKLKNHDDLRKHPEIKNNWQDSLQKMISVLQNQITCIASKDKPIKVCSFVI